MSQQPRSGQERQRQPAIVHALLLLVSLSALWALVTPLGAVPDEPAHVIQAAAVVRGQLGGGSDGRQVVVPSDVAASTTQTCPAFRPDVTADCQPALSETDAQTTVSSGAARYPPLYYALVGWPTRADFSAHIWYFMRLLSVALMAGLLLVGSRAWSERTRPALVAGLLLAWTPMAAFMAGSVNPNGCEIAAGVAFVLAAAGLVERWRLGVPARSAAVAVAVTGGYLTLARPGSHLLAIALGLVLILYAGPYLVVVLRSRRRRRLTLPIAVLLGGVVVALIYARATRLPPGPAGPPGVTPGAALATVLRDADAYVLETIGIFGWRDHQPPLPLAALWVGLVVALLISAWLVSRRHERLSLLALALGSCVVAPVFIFLTLFRDGVGYQARYAMPLVQALPVLAGALVSRQDWPPGSASARGIAVLPRVLLVLHLLCLGGSYLRYAVGLPFGLQAILPSDLEWVPPLWPLVVALLAAVVVLTELVVRDLREHEPAPDVSVPPTSQAASPS